RSITGAACCRTASGSDVSLIASKIVLLFTLPVFSSRPRFPCRLSTRSYETVAQHRRHATPSKAGPRHSRSSPAIQLYAPVSTNGKSRISRLVEAIARRPIGCLTPSIDATLTPARKPHPSHSILP
ncbi:hypothetical protein GGTG_13508, partial [Gaeumannomyces tritici R3-111a-1]